jgi:hypothetical protein
VRLAAGDRVAVRLCADFVGLDYVWRWETRVTGVEATPKASFRQSTWLATPLSPERLRRRADAFVPSLTDEARVDRRILELMDRAMSLRAIAEHIAAAFPSSVRNLDAALARVAALSDRYSQSGDAWRGGRKIPAS